MPIIPAHHDALLNHLASLMLTRHLRVCLPEETLRGLDRLPRHWRNASIADRSRVIAVVGAGASHPPLDRGDALVQRLEQGEVNRVEYEAEIRRITSIYKLSRDDFETRLFALTRTPHLADTVREKLATIHDVRHPTRLTYELLAHLLKHRFLDAIITFNFDEMLDQSLDDELGNQEYVRIISERDCSRLSPDPAAHDYLPHYIKLHGTTSDADSLRFTRQSYYSVPRAVARLIESLLGGHRCVIINIGFAMRSFEFCRLLSRPQELRIFSLAEQSLSAEAFAEIQAERNPRIQRTHIESIASSEWTAGANEFPAAGTDLPMQALVERIRSISELTNGVVEFRNTARHRAVSALFGWLPVDADAALREVYLQDRTTIEMAFSALRGRGLVSASSIVSDRSGAYFGLLRHQNQHAPWLEACRRGGLRPSSVPNETFVAIDSVRVNSNTPIDELDIGSTRISPERLASHVEGTLSEMTRDALERYFPQGGLADVFRDIATGTEVEIHSQEDNICSKVFQEARILPTTTSLRAQTIEMLDAHSYDQLAVVAETGEWLLGEPYYQILTNRPEVRIFLIVAFGTKLDALRLAYGDRLSVVCCHWWRHNRHMTLIVRGDQAEAGIYFARPRRSLFITPVYVWRDRDKQTLLRSFFTYWLRSSAMPPAVRPSDFPVRLTELADAGERVRLRALDELNRRGTREPSR